MVKTKQTMLAQLILRAVIFLLFLLGIFIVVPGLRYIFILFIIANIVLGFINGKKDILANMSFVILTPWLFVPVLEYLITIILEVILGIHLVMFYLWFRKGGVKEEKDKKVKKGEEEKKKFHIPAWLIVLLIIMGVFLLLLILVILAFAGFSSVSSGVQVAG